MRPKKEFSALWISMIAVAAISFGVGFASYVITQVYMAYKVADQPVPIAYRLSRS